MVLDGEANRRYFLCFSPTPEEVCFTVGAVVFYLLDNGGSIFIDAIELQSVNLIAVVAQMDFHIRNVGNDVDWDPLTRLVRLDQGPVRVLAKLAQGCGKCAVSLRYDTCVLLAKAMHYA